MSLATGTRLGPYEVLGLIGAGGMGEVYKARDTRLDRTVAIKVLPADISDDPDRRARFEREARTIAGLTHPHICTLHDVGEHGGSMFLVMEYMEGQTLAERLRKGALPIDQSLDIGAQIADALAAAHRAGIIHRDLKPANVMLTKSGVKLLDFGLAKLKHKPVQATVARATGIATRTEPLTGEGTLLGTLQYMAPEQLEGKDTDARTDIWALGLVLYEMVTGTRAFDGQSSASVIADILARQPARMTAIQPVAPSALDRLVRRCLAKDPDQRWDTAHDVAEELRWVAEAEPLGALRPQSPAVHRAHSRVFHWASGVVLVAAAAAFLWFAASRVSAPGAPPTNISSIAVLPLENLSRDDAQEFFADGLTDALITELAHIRALRVISRTSVMRYKKTRKSVGEISKELNGVGAVLEGTVMHAGDRVAITVQLIDASRDQHLWSQTYERDLSDILTLRREIARTIAREIRIATVGDQDGSTRAPRKVNPVAYEQYLRAIMAETAGASEQTTREWIAAAEQAVRLDPEFAPAYATLAHANATLWWYHWDHSTPRADQARAAADRALALDPELAEAHSARAYISYWIDLDYPAALSEFGIALGKTPSDARTVMGMASVQRRQGRLDEAVRNFERAAALNPLDANLAFNLGESYALQRDCDKAESNFDRALSVQPGYPRALAYKLRWRFRIRPEPAQALQIEKQGEALGAGSDPIFLYHLLLLHLSRGDGRRALQLLAQTQRDTFEEQFWYVPRAYLEGQAHEISGDRVHARDSFTAARRLLEAKLAQASDDTRVRSALGLTLAYLGDADGAVREGKAAVAEMPVTREAYRGAYRLEDLARIYAIVGRRDAAVDVVRQLLSIPDDLSAPGVQLDPAFRTLRGYAGFENLVAAPR